MLEAPPSPDTKPALPATSQTPPPRKPHHHPSVDELNRPSSQPLPPIQHSKAGNDPLRDGDDRDSDREERLERTKSWTEQSFGGSDVDEESRTEQKAKDKSADEPVFLTQVCQLDGELSINYFVERKCVSIHPLLGLVNCVLALR